MTMASTTIPIVIMMIILKRRRKWIRCGRCRDDIGDEDDDNDDDDDEDDDGDDDDIDDNDDIMITCYILPHFIAQGIEHKKKYMFTAISCILLFTIVLYYLSLCKTRIGYQCVPVNSVFRIEYSLLIWTYMN